MLVNDVHQGMSRRQIQDWTMQGTVCAFNPESSYMNKGLFLQWLTNFVANVETNVTAKILLHLDGHLTHNNSTEAPQLECDSGVVIILLPGHTMCRVQPLDVELLRLLSS